MSRREFAACLLMPSARESRGGKHSDRAASLFPPPLWGRDREGGDWSSLERNTPSRPARAKSDVSDLANVNAEIGNCRFRMARDIAMPCIAFFEERRPKAAY